MVNKVRSQCLSLSAKERTEPKTPQLKAKMPERCSQALKGPEKEVTCDLPKNSQMQLGK